MTDLNQLIPPGSDWVLKSVSDINDAGQIVGTGEAPNGETHGFLLTPIVVGIPDVKEKYLPERFGLSQNYPNPFNATTAISYSLSEPSDVTIEIYDILGRKIDILSPGQQQAGEHNVLWNADNQTSGVYFYRIQTGKYSETKKMVLLK